MDDTHTLEGEPEAPRKPAAKAAPKPKSPSSADPKAESAPKFPAKPAPRAAADLPSASAGQVSMKTGAKPGATPGVLHKAKARTFFVPRSLAEAFATNERINQYLLDALDKKVWRADPPSGGGRTVAQIVAHMHNVRHMWLVVTAPGQPVPDKLDRNKCTRKQAQSALKKSAKCMVDVIRQAAESPEGRVKDFKPDVVGFLAYAIAHEAHHRGQICMLARELGHPLSQDVHFGMWEWSKRWKDCGFE